MLRVTKKPSMLIVVMLSVIILSVVMLNVVAPSLAFTIEDATEIVSKFLAPVILYETSIIMKLPQYATDGFVSIWYYHNTDSNTDSSNLKKKINT
jgi:hypothetical protein